MVLIGSLLEILCPCRYADPKRLAYRKSFCRNHEHENLPSRPAERCFSSMNLAKNLVLYPLHDVFYFRPKLHTFHHAFFFLPVKIYTKTVRTNTPDNFKNSIIILSVQGNFIGRSCHRISVETIKAQIRLMICFTFIVYLLVGIVHPLRGFSLLLQNFTYECHILTEIKCLWRTSCLR